MPEHRLIRQPPQVTVIVPTRNRARFLRASLESALGQRDVDVEVLVVDDGSTDETPAALAALARDGLRVIRLDKPGGVAAARNRGLAEARGEWVAFLDDDDRFAPRKLRWQLDAAARVGASWAFGAAVVVDEDDAVLRYGRPPQPDGLDRDLLNRNVIPGGCSNVVARTELLRRLGGFDTQLRQLADRDLWLRLAQNAPAAACDRIVVAYLVHAGNMRAQRRHDGVDELEYLLEKHRTARREAGVPVNRKPGYRYFARAHLESGRRMRAASIFTRVAVLERSHSDLARAAWSLAFGARVSALRGRLRPAPRRLAEDEIAWLRERTPEEIAWLRGLTEARLGPPAAASSPAPARDGETSLFSGVPAPGIR